MDVKEHICQVCFYTAPLNSRKDHSGGTELQLIIWNSFMREKYNFNYGIQAHGTWHFSESFCYFMFCFIKLLLHFLLN